MPHKPHRSVPSSHIPSPRASASARHLPSVRSVRTDPDFSDAQRCAVCSAHRQTINSERTSPSPIHNKPCFSGPTPPDYYKTSKPRYILTPYPLLHAQSLLVMASFRIFTRAARPTTSSFFTSSASSYSTKTSSQGMSGVGDIFHVYGPSVFKGLAVAGVGGAVISRFMMTTAEAESPNKEGKKIFGRAGPVFTRLALESTENVNHNTKKLSFKLPGEGAVSGLPLTCESSPAGRM